MKPFPFQDEVVEEIESFGGRALVSAEMGLGKTLMALLYLDRHRNTLPTVVVCPATIKYHWEHEAMAWIKLRASILEGQKPSRNGRVRPKLVIVNYDILQYWLKWLRRLKPQTVIIDESQYTANPRAKRTESVKLLCKGVPHVIALSGTPLVNRPIELFPILNILRKDVFKSRYCFAQDYCNPKWTPWGWDYKGASHTKQLHRLLSKTVMIRRRKVDVLKELPTKVRRVFPLPMKDGDEYHKATTDFAGWLQRQDPLKAQRALKAEAMTKMGYLLRLAARKKLYYVVEWVNQFLRQTDEKLVLFAVHRKMIEALKRRCDTRSVVVDGGISGRKRQLVVNQFQNDNRVRLLIGNIQAAGIGITLTAASTVAFSEMDWVPGHHIQAEDRIHRIGAKGTAWCWYLVAHDTIEEKLCSIIQEKQKVLSAVLDGGRMPEDLDVYDQLLREMKSDGK